MKRLSRRPSAPPPAKRAKVLSRSTWALLAAVLFTPAVALSALGEKPAPATPKPAASHVLVQETTPSCGETADADCPLQGWMKANAAAALDARDSIRLERALRRLAKLAPAGYAGWERVSLAAAEAAKRGDFAAVRGSCKECHSSHRAAYRREHRPDPLH